MSPVLAFIILLACFGVVGRIDYEVALETAQPPANTYARNSDASH